MKYKLFFGILLLDTLLLATLILSASISSGRGISTRKTNQHLVKILMLTDLALWTEARYSRHPSQADFFAAFQDFPAAIERLPSGSLTGPAVVYNLAQAVRPLQKISGEPEKTYLQNDGRL